MQQIRISDDLYKQAERRASEAGFSSVDEYVADVLSNDRDEYDVEGSPNLDHLFTPERLAEVDKARAQIAAGQSFTSEEVREHFKKKREEWKRRNGQG